MTLYYIIVFFILGIVLGSFYNVVGYRLPRGESIVFPSSHCTNCGHKLTPIELIPIFSYLFLGRKCRSCKCKISPFYCLFELTTGILFSVSYVLFGLSIDLLINLTFISCLLIIVISDYQTMIIPDEVLIVTAIALIVQLLVGYGIEILLLDLLDGIIMFMIMFSMKKVGDFIFGKESMGGGDIKLMFLYGLYFGWPTSCMSICLASFIGLPISLILLKKNNSHEIPFGPFLAVAAIIMIIFNINIQTLIDYLTV